MTNPDRNGNTAAGVTPPDVIDPDGSLVVAGLGRRLGARCVDTLLRLPLAYFIFAWSAFLYWNIWGERDTAGPPQNWIVSWVAGAVLVAYEPVVISRTGCTLGKLMFGIRVRQRSDPTRTPTLCQALVRWAVPVVWGGVLLWVSWEALAALLLDDYGGRGGDIFSFIDGGRETPFAENDLAWVLLNAVFYGVVAGLPFMSGVLCIAGRLRPGNGSSLHDRAARTIVLRSSANGDGRTSGGSG
ncbi:RDD family protein [Candidatus Poriferisodalis sp.]|uniref:RDD family protein n=1 Tax=Candidatus Poriferisodalis sp. TaxID=3101277 RepID=UPI003B01210A